MARRAWQALEMVYGSETLRGDPASRPPVNLECLLAADTCRPRGRPSIVAQYAPQVAQWLREHADLSGIEILRRVRLAGYRGRKSALYELVKQVRVGAGQPVEKLPAEVTVAVESSLGSGPVPGVTRR